MATPRKDVCSSGLIRSEDYFVKSTLKLSIITFLHTMKETTYKRRKQDQYAKGNRNQQRRGINGNMTPSEPLDSTVPETMTNSSCLQLLLFLVCGLIIFCA